ncbi:hypothetical protein NEDG_00952 [Nematocida displodere]|uniref:RRM domain-containing protein n=1 Tax=Nematocida displodere TaxID=1805483 RepID=A0A177EA50_9MICR|nr:hypothetical protein NEDG_00952 [Nematocida displodere]
MNIFKYAPNWSEVERRKELLIKNDDVPSRKNPLNNIQFKLKATTKQKKKAENVLCVHCKKEKHLPSMCPEKPQSAVKAADTTNIYKCTVVLSPTTIKLINIPTTVTRDEMKGLLIQKGVHYDSINLLYDKINREEFKGVIYIELPTKDEAEKCMSIFDGMRMGIQIISGVVLEPRANLSRS